MQETMPVPTEGSGLNTNKKYILGALGLISGIICSIFAPSISLKHFPSLDIVSNLPGIVFGATLAFYFLFSGKISLGRIMKTVLFILVSIGAWIAAVIAPVVVFLMFIGTFVGGFVGGGILLIGVHIIFKPLTFKKIFVGAIISGLLGLSLHISFYLDGSNVAHNLPILYIIWQTGIALFIGWDISTPSGASQEQTKLTAYIFSLSVFGIIFFLLPGYLIWGVDKLLHLGGMTFTNSGSLGMSLIFLSEVIALSLGFFISRTIYKKTIGNQGVPPELNS